MYEILIAAGLEILTVAGLLAVIAILVIAVILLLANLGAWLTKIAQGTTSFITTGDTLQEILPNVGGYKMSREIDLEGQRWLVPVENALNEKEEQLAALFHDSMSGSVRFQKWLWKTFGVKFIGWSWPHTRVHKFDIRKGGRRRIEARNEVALDAPLRSRVIDSPGTTVVDSLLFFAPRPVYMEGVELAGDNSKINLLLLPVFRQVIPSLPVFNLKGDFFTLLDAAIEAAVVDFFAKHRVAVHKKDEAKRGQLAEDSYVLPEDVEKARKYQEMYEESPLTYAHWLKLRKAGGESPLEKSLRHLNVSKGYVRKLESAKKEVLLKYINSDLSHGNDASDTSIGTMPSGIVPRFGYALVSFRSVEWEPHKSTEPLAISLLAKETELHNAEGVRQAAYGRRDALKALAEGESSRYERIMKALVDTGVDANIASQVVQTQLRTENIRDSDVTTYVEGGASASVLVSASSSKPSTAK